MTDSNNQNPSNPYGDPSTSPFGGSGAQQPEGQSTYGDTGQQGESSSSSSTSYGSDSYGASSQGSSAQSSSSQGSSSYGSESYGSSSEAPSGYGEAAHTSDPNAYTASDASYGLQQGYGQQQSYGEQQGYGQQQGYGEGGYSGQADAAAYGGQQSYNGQVATSSGYGNYAQPAAGGEKRGMSITAMCCGIGGLLIALAFGWFSFGWLSGLACIAAIILGIIGLRREPRGKGFAITAIITGGLGLLLSIVQIILWIVFLSAAASIVDTYGTYTYSTY